MKNYRVTFIIDDEEVHAYPEFSDFMFPTDKEIVNEGIAYIHTALGKARSDGQYTIYKPRLNRDGKRIFNG